MKTFFAAALSIMAILCSSLRAEQAVASSADATSASAAVPMTPATPAEPTAFDHVVYLARLPSPSELMQGAKSQGATVTRMDQTSDRIVVVYDYPSGRSVTFAYTLLSAAAEYPAPALRAGAASPTAPASRAVYTTVSTPATEVIYTEPETVYYSRRYVRYYEPAWDFWTPLALGVGIGLIGGHGHGWHGGHGGWHGGHAGHGGWHR